MRANIAGDNGSFLAIAGVLMMFCVLFAVMLFNFNLYPQRFTAKFFQQNGTKLSDFSDSLVRI